MLHCLVNCPVFAIAIFPHHFQDQFRYVLLNA
jgi:hypothetical protein